MPDRRHPRRALTATVLSALALTGSPALAGPASALTGTLGAVVDSTTGTVTDPLTGTSATAAETDAEGYTPAKDRYSLFRSGAVVGARDAWRATRAGAGVDVALVDSGIARVPGLDAPGHVLGGPDFSVEQATPSAGQDTFGHGTHMAGIIAGRDPGPDPAADAGPSTRFLGIAPGARLVPVKVADARGTTDVTQVIAALEWVTAHARTDGRRVRVVNLSFGTDGLQDYRVDPLARAVQRAWRSGLVVVVSAGNSGRERLANPAFDPYVIAVAADDTVGTAETTDDAVPAFSNRGDGTRDPDLAAPGVRQQSLRAPGSRIDRAHGHTGRIGTRYFRGTGTSQSAAVVSGAAALLLAQRPELTPDQVKHLLRSTARPLPGAGSAAAGRGLLDVAAAVAAPTPDAAAVRQAWPTSDGSGSLAAARGSAGRLVGSVTGEVGDGGAEVLAQTTDPVSVAAAPAAAGRALKAGQLVSSWGAGTFSEVAWTGNAWTGNAWTGNAWTGNAWTGNAWTGTAWTGNAWTGGAWNGGAWSGGAWNGNAWTGSTWE